MIGRDDLTMLGSSGSYHRGCWLAEAETRIPLVNATRDRTESVAAVARYLVAQSTKPLPGLVVSGGGEMFHPVLVSALSAPTSLAGANDNDCYGQLRFQAQEAAYAGRW